MNFAKIATQVGYRGRGVIQTAPCVEKPWLTLFLVSA